jgi:RNA polymerase sigma-70 factor (ECF subfamily)
MVVTGDLPDPPSATIDESDMVAALRTGDADAFRHLVSDLNPGLTRLARTYVPNALADEVVQETWATVIQIVDTFEGRSSLKTWIYRIMLNKVRTLAGRESKIIPFAAMGNAEGDNTAPIPSRLLKSASLGPGHWTNPPEAWRELPANVIERRELLMMVLAAIKELPPSQREVVELRDVQGWAPQDVCETLGISSVNQRVLLHRGRARIRAMLEEYLSNDD